MSPGNADYVNAIGARIGHSGQTIPHNTVTALTYSTVEFDSGGVANLAGNSLIAPVDGLYALRANVRWNITAGAREALFFTVNGSGLGRVEREAMGGTMSMANSEVLPLAAGDEVQTQVFQNSGAAAATNASFGGLHFSIGLLGRI